MATEGADALVLGAGIAGCALAYHLARGKFGRVVVLDPATPAAGATGRAAGIVTEQLWDRWDVATVRESREEYARLAVRHDPSACRVNGFLRWTSRADVVPLLAAATERLHDWGVEVEELSAAEVARRLPWARCDDLLGASFAPGDAIVAPTRLAELYLREARSLGVEFELGLSEVRLEGSQGRWQVTAGQRSWRAPCVVVAAGAWSKRLLASAGAPIPLTPYRTQAALLRPGGPAVPEFPSFHDIDLDVYARPEEAGRVLVGDGTDAVEADPTSFVTGGDERFVTHLAESFASRLPGWKDAEMLRAWAGVCVATPDRHPLIGPVPGAPGLCALTGFNGFGVMRAGGAAARLAQAIGEPEREADLLGPTLPGRFSRPYPAFPPKPGFTLEAGDEPRY